MSGHKGLYNKYKVIRVDTGEEVTGCFVMRPETDIGARLPCRLYTFTGHNPRLNEQLAHWLDEIEGKKRRKKKP